MMRKGIDEKQMQVSEAFSAFELAYKPCFVPPSRNGQERGDGIWGRGGVGVWDPVAASTEGVDIFPMRPGSDQSDHANQHQDVGHKGYICPLCSRAYSALQIPTLFSPAHNAFLCEDDKTELIEHVPDETDSSDKMQRFNRATQPIRDALRAVEGLTLPTVNILAWVAENVKSTVVLAEEDGEGPKGGKVQVVLGGEGEREKLERERLAEQQRSVGNVFCRHPGGVRGRNLRGIVPLRRMANECLRSPTGHKTSFLSGTRTPLSLAPRPPSG